MDVADPPRIDRPPPNWQAATVPSGSLFKFYAYESFDDVLDWETGKMTRKLAWKRACFFIPKQTFNIMQLQTDNSWDCIGTVIGPIGYFSLDAKDGQAQVLRLQAA